MDNQGRCRWCGSRDFYANGEDLICNDCGNHVPRRFYDEGYEDYHEKDSYESY